uniref:LRRNT domain-containing protein n=1 Tax=Eptatretus burgeri TaxID=7764 RepID=A0A8C4R9X8_EPTBU
MHLMIKLELILLYVCTIPRRPMDLFLHNPSLPLLCISLLWTTGAVNCTQCPTDCKCYKDTSTVLCVEGKYSILPQSLPESTQALFVFKNRFTNISSESFFKLPKLITLDLSHNYIERITDRTFSPLYGLKNLDLSYNHLHTISIHAFQGLVFLERLYLHNNKLGRSELGNVYQMPHLLELKLHDNHLQNIECIQTPNLLLLDLSRNRISKLSPGTLKQLDLELVNIPMVVQRVSKLTQLNISNNPLRCPLRKDTLEMLIVIKVLDVRKTILSEISRCFLPNASSFHRCITCLYNIITFSMVELVQLMEHKCQRYTRLINRTICSLG